MKSDSASTTVEPERTPGKETSWASGLPLRELTNGRARMSVPPDPATNRSRLSSRKKKSPATPNVWQSLSQAPAFSRNPLRQSSLTRRPPKSTAVPGPPRVPATPRGVPGGAAVTSGGTGCPDATQ